MTNGTSNIGRLINWFRTTEEPLHTATEGFRVVLGGQFGLPPEWISGARPVRPISGETLLRFSAPPPVLLALVALAVAWLVHRRQAAGLRLAGVVGAGLVLGVIAVARTNGTLYEYRLRWAWSLALGAAALVAWTAWQAGARRWPGVAPRVLVPLALLGLAGLSTANVVGAVRAGDPQSAQPVADIGRFTDEAVAALPDRPGVVLVGSESVGGTFAAQGLLLALEKRGFAARSPSDPGRWYGNHRVHDDGPVRATLTLASDEGYDRYAAQVAEDPALAELIAYQGDLSPSERPLAAARYERRAAELDAAFEAGDIGVQERLEGLDAASPGKAVGLFLELRAEDS